MSRRALLAAGALAAVLSCGALSGCGGSVRQAPAPPASTTTATGGTTGGTTGTTTGTTGTSLTDQEVSEMERIVSAAETAAGQAAR
jgi:hypothetical protein